MQRNNTQHNWESVNECFYLVLAHPGCSGPELRDKGLLTLCCSHKCNAVCGPPPFTYERVNTDSYGDSIVSADCGSVWQITLNFMLLFSMAECSVLVFHCAAAFTIHEEQWCIGGVYAGIRRIPTSGVFLTAYTHLSDHK